MPEQQKKKAKPMAAAKQQKAPPMAPKPAKQQPKPKKDSKPAKPKGDVFDAFNPSIPKSLLPVGKGLPVHGIIRNQLNLSVGDRTLYFICNVGGTGTTAFKVSFTAASVLSREAMTIPTLSSSALAGGATSLKALAATIHVVNTTQLYNVSGQLYALEMSQRLNFAAAPLSMTAANWGSVYDVVVAHPDCRMYSASQAINGLKFSCGVNDNTQFDTFYPNRGPLASDDWFEHVAQWSAADAMPRPMTTYVIAMSSPAVAQSYTVTAASQVMSRWPVDTITGQLMKDVPVGSHSEVVNERKGKEPAAGGSR